MPSTFLCLVVAAAAPSVEIVLPEAVIEELLAAVSPVEESSRFALLGGTAEVHVRLTNPRVKVDPAGIRVTLDYEVWDGSGLVKLSGVAQPRMEIVKPPGSSRLQGRLVDAGITLPGGVVLPLERFIAPLTFPDSVSQSIRLGKRVANLVATPEDVKLEPGRIRIKAQVALERL